MVLFSNILIHERCVSWPGVIYIAGHEGANFQSRMLFQFITPRDSINIISRQGFLEVIVCYCLTEGRESKYIENLNSNIILLVGVPEPVKDCRSNISSLNVIFSCIPGYSGGEQQHFLLKLNLSRGQDSNRKSFKVHYTHIIYIYGNWLKNRIGSL